MSQYDDRKSEIQKLYEYKWEATKHIPYTVCSYSCIPYYLKAFSVPGWCEVMICFRPIWGIYEEKARVGVWQQQQWRPPQGGLTNQPYRLPTPYSFT